MTPDERSSLLAPFAVFAVAGVALYFIVRLPDAAKLEEQALARDPIHALFQAIELPATVSQPGTCSYVLKGSSRSYTCAYAVAGTRESIEEQFARELALKGWERPRRTPHEVWWCQGDFVAVLSPPGSDGRLSFAIQTAAGSDWLPCRHGGQSLAP